MVKVKVENNHGSIRLRFQHDKSRYVFSPIASAKYSNPDDVALAEAVATIISSDIKHQRFDATLVKYKSVLLKDFAELPQEVAGLTKAEFLSTWNSYVEYKIQAGLSCSTISVDYGKRMLAVLNGVKDKHLSDFDVFYSWLLKTHSVESVRRILVQLNACFHWADSKYKEEFKKMLTRHQQSMKATRRRKRPEDDINPFSVEERDQIIELFSTDRYYSYYAPLVTFLFLVGCRPSEALALTWGDCELDEVKPKINFNKAYVADTLQNHLKTQQRRSILIPSKVTDLLVVRKKSAVSSLVFPALKDVRKYINWSNFTRRAWCTVLKKLPAVEYRNPYQMRHTYITLALQQGELIKDVANYCGTSPGMIMNFYAGATRDYMPPDL